MVGFGTSIDCALRSATNFGGLPGKDLKNHLSSFLLFAK